jgi:hypothetical protein
MMGLYRKKPVMVEAVRFDGCEYVDDVPEPMFEGSFDVVPEWLVDAQAKREGEAGAAYVDRDGNSAEVAFVLAIVTLEGTVYAQPGDFIIRGTAGELYPCKPDIFASIYDAASPDAQKVLEELAGGDAAEAPGIGRTTLTAKES